MICIKLWLDLLFFRFSAQTNFKGFCGIGYNSGFFVRTVHYNISYLAFKYVLRFMDMVTEQFIRREVERVYNGDKDFELNLLTLNIIFITIIVYYYFLLISGG